MTTEELDLIKNSILDVTEAYTDTIVKTLPLTTVEIGIITGVGTNKGNKVLIKDTYEYDNITSISNVIYSNGSVVRLLIPNGQYTNMFILGMLADGDTGLATKTEIKDVVDLVSAQYYSSTSSTSPQGGQWSDTVPQIEQGKYIWQRIKTVKVNGEISYSPSEDGVCITSEGDADVSVGGVNFVDNSYYLQGVDFDTLDIVYDDNQTLLKDEFDYILYE